MGKSDDSISRRRNKKINRKQENKRDLSSKVSARVATIIATKKRRQTGKRRMCQGMCFSLPSPEDPFNDRQGKTELTRKRRRASKANKKLKDKNSHRLKKESFGENIALKITEPADVKNTMPAFVSSTSFMGPEIATSVGKIGSVNNPKSSSKYVSMNAVKNGESN